MRKLTIPKNVKEFVYDGCHKIYLIENAEQKKELKEKGYIKTDIWPIKLLAKVYDESCPLRFVSFWDLDKDSLINQCEE